MIRRLLLIACAALAAAVVAGCGSDADADGADGKLKVTTTTNWHTDLARVVGGDLVSVEGLMGPGVDPHLYTATAGDVATLSDSDVAIWNGLELEGKLDDVFAEIGERVPVVTVGDAVPEADRIPIEGVDDEFDPHIWFDPEAWKLAATAVAEGFSEADPENADVYSANLDEFIGEIDEADAEARQLLESVSEGKRILVTSHDAFSYFARSYGFEVAPIQGKSTASEATTADIERVAGVVAESGLDAVFIESSVPQQTIDAVLAAAEQRGQQTRVGGELLGDSLGSPGEANDSYAGALLYNAEQIAEGLGGG